MEHPNLQFETSVQSQGSVSTVLIAHCSSKLLVLVQLAKKNRVFCCSRSTNQHSLPNIAHSSLQFSAECLWKMTNWSKTRCFTSDWQLENRADAGSAPNVCMTLWKGKKPIKHAAECRILTKLSSSKKSQRGQSWRSTVMRKSISVSIYQDRPLQSSLTHQNLSAACEHVHSSIFIRNTLNIRNSCNIRHFNVLLCVRAHVCFCCPLLDFFFFFTYNGWTDVKFRYFFSFAFSLGAFLPKAAQKQQFSRLLLSWRLSFSIKVGGPAQPSRLSLPPLKSFQQWCSNSPNPEPKKLVCWKLVILLRVNLCPRSPACVLMQKKIKIKKNIALLLSLLGSDASVRESTLLLHSVIVVTRLVGFF